MALVKPASKKELILAPMVRACSLPFRVLCHEYGATSTYSPELIDLKLTHCIMKQQQIKHGRGILINFLSENDFSPVFSTCPAIDHPIILQLGTSNPETAISATRMVSSFVDGIDINCGCTMQFSTQGGMGSALTRTPNVLRDILCSIKRELDPLNKPVSCKIRLSETPEKTVSFIRDYIIPSGCSNICIHARTASESFRAKPRWEELRRVRELLELNSGINNLRLIANGGVHSREDIQKIREATGINAVMIGKTAIENASIFANQQLPVLDVVQRFLELCVDFGNSLSTSKFVILQMLLSLPRVQRNPLLISKLPKAKNLREICEMFGKLDYYEANHIIDNSTND